MAETMGTEIKPLITILFAVTAFLIGVRLVKSYQSPRGCLNVALLGDSLTSGSEYRTTLEDMLGPCNVVQAFAYPNQQTAYIEAQIPNVLFYDPFDVVILAGVNDLASGKSVASVIERLDRMYRNLQSVGVRVTAVTLTPWSDHVKGKNLQVQTAQVNDWIQFQSTANLIVDTSSMDDSTLVGPDGLHLNAKGQARLAQLVYQKLSR